MRYDVYSITCTVNERVYFGRSQEIEKRWRSHKNMLRRGNHNNTLLQKDWNLYGEEAFRFNILNSYTSKEESEKKEQEYIDDPTYNKYNISNAKIGGDTFTNNPRQEEIRKLKSINSAGKNNPMYGKPKSEYTIQRIKEANSKPLMIENTYYISATEASNKLGLGITTILYRVNAHSDRFKSWKYVK